MLRKVLLLVSWLMVAIAGSAQAGFIEEINRGPGYATPFPGCCIWVPDTIGWYWTPSTTVNPALSVGQTVQLTNVQTQLADLLNGINNNFNMTIGVYTDRPAVGGTLIRNFTFNAFGVNIPDQGFRGTGFASPVPLVAGTQYFFGFSGWSQVAGFQTGGGINYMARPDGSLGGSPAPDGARSLGFGYTGAQWESRMGDVSGLGLSAPTIRFIYDIVTATDPGTPGAPGTSVVPVPGALPLMLSALALFGAFVRRRPRG